MSDLGTHRLTPEQSAEADRIAAELGGGQAPPSGSQPKGARRVVLTSAAAITPERLRWLWQRRIVLRGLSVIAGEPGLGKSTATVELAAEVTRGDLDGDLQGEPHDVLIATAEDHFASVVWGRLTAAGADMERVHRVSVEDRDGEDLLTIPDDVAEIEQRCAELAAGGRPVGFVVVDPVAAFIGAGTDTHRDAAVRRVLTPLAQLAERQQLAVVAVAHLNKDTAGKLLSRVGGSTAFGAAPRSVLAFARHPDDPEGDQGNERVIVAAKSNHGGYAPTLAARIEGREVPEVGSVSRLVITGECEVGPDDLGEQTGGDRHERDEAVEFLRAELADGPRPTREVKRTAADADISDATLKRARKTLGVKAEKEGRGGWSLCLPEQGDHPPGHGTPYGEGEPLEPLASNPHRERDSGPSEPPRDGQEAQSPGVSPLNPLPPDAIPERGPENANGSTPPDEPELPLASPEQEAERLAATFAPADGEPDQLAPERLEQLAADDAERSAEATADALPVPPCRCESAALADAEGMCGRCGRVPR